MIYIFFVVWLMDVLMDLTDVTNEDLR